MDNVQCFVCGPPTDHKCDSDGPELIGGTDAEGNPWQAESTEENRKRKGCTWGSVSCSKCGMSAQENAVWERW